MLYAKLYISFLQQQTFSNRIHSYSLLNNIWLFVDFWSSLRTGSGNHHCGHNNFVDVLQTMLIKIKNINVL